MIKFYEKFYYGYRPNGNDRLPLGFATPYEDNAAFRKRQKTVDEWVSGRWGRNQEPLGKTGMIFENVPMKGFSVADVVSRWTTSNKLYRVDDPRGFQLEINTDNLLRLIDRTTIVRGEIQDELVWGREGSNNILWPADSDEYRAYLNPDNYTHEPGDAIKVDMTHDRGHYVYLGKRYVHIVTKREELKDHGYHRFSNRYEYIRHYIDEGLDTKPFHVYISFTPGKDNGYNHGRYTFRRSPFKKGQYEKYEGEVPSFEQKDNWMRFDSMTSHSYISACRIYEEKVEVEKKEPSRVRDIINHVFDRTY